MFRPTLFRFLLLSVAVIGMTRHVQSQDVSAGIVGIVTDSQRLPVSGASVITTNEATNQVHGGVTASDGQFSITHLPAGSYRVTVAAPGFRSFKAVAFMLEAGQVRRLAVQLQVGQTHTEVTVTAPSGRLDTDTAARGELIPGRLVEGLPLNDRNYMDLAVLAPGVYHRVGSDEQGEGLSASGTRTDAAAFSLDAVVNRSDRSGTPGVGISLDAVREFDVQTSGYGSASGRTGGAQIIVVSRSGANRLAGSLFGYLRHDAFDARNLFAPPGESPLLRRQQLGGAVGGPVRRDRAFFFAAYERLRERRSLAANTTAPSADWLRGDFRNLRGAGADGLWGNSDDTNRLLDPWSRKEFPTANLIPDSVIDPVARQMLPFVPAANLAGTVNGYAASGRMRDDRHSLNGRFDTLWKSGTALSARWSRAWGDNYDPFSALRNFYPGFGRQESRRLDSVALAGVTGIGRHWLNEARLGYFDHHQERVGENSSTDYLSQFGIPGNSLDRTLWGFPSIRIDGLAEFGDRPNDPSNFTARNFQFSDTVSRTIGPHTLRAGVDIIRSIYRELDVRNIRGDFRFRGRYTNPAKGPSSGFRAFADFLIGLPDQTQRQIGANPAVLRGWQTAWFIQDDWRATRKLTLIGGLRYDRQTPLSESSNRLANFVPSLGEVVLAGDPRFPEALLWTENQNIAPRIGFAFRPFADGRTVVRGGAGIYYSLETFNVTRQQLGLSYPFVRREQYSGQGNDPLSLTFQNPFPAAGASVQGIDQPLGMALDYRTPRYYHFNLTVERELAADLTLSAGYVGSQGRHLGRRYNLNQPIPKGLGSDGGLITERPFAAFADIQFQDQSSNSSYHGLQASVRRRISGGLTLLATHSFSRTIDTGSISTGNLGNVSTSGAQKSPQNIYDMRAERGLSDLHRAQQFTGAFVLDLPFGAGRRFQMARSRLADAMLRGWQVSGIVTLLSGRPFTPQYTAGDFAAQRPDLVADPYAAIPSGLWFNPDAFARPVATLDDPSLDGNAGRNILVGPAFRNLDVAFVRKIGVGEHTAIQLRAEAFNVFNHPNYQLPVFLLDRVDAGRVTATANQAREWQFAVRLIF